MRTSAFDRVLDSAAWAAVSRAAVSRRARLGILSPPASLPANERGLLALETYLAGSAFERARRVAEEMLESGIDPRDGKAALAVLRALAAFGDARLVTIAKHARPGLLTNRQGASWLVALGLLGGGWHLPDGRFDLAWASREIERGELDADDVRTVLGRRPLQLLQQPQAHLVHAHALARASKHGVGAALSRFLSAFSVSGVRVDVGESSLLARVRPRRRATTHDGPSVSVVVAAYRAKDTIGYALDSLLDQSYRPIEILVCDDASDDGTLEWIMDRYGRVPQVRVFRSARNQGPYGIRNALLAQARGDLLTFQDADDFALPERVARQVAAMRRLDAVACVTRMVRVTPSGRFVFFHDQSAHRLSVPSLMMTRAAYEAVGPYRAAAFGADHELLEDLRQRFLGRIAYIRRPLKLMLWSDRSLTRAAGSESLEDGFRSPRRRLYAELVYERRHGLVEECDVREQLANAGILREPAPVEEL